MEDVHKSMFMGGGLLVLISAIITLITSSAFYNCKEDKDKSKAANNVVYISGPIVLITSLITSYILHKNNMALAIWLFISIIILLVLIILNTVYSNKMKEDEKDVFMINNRMKTLTGFFGFLFIGLVFWIITNCDSIRSLLCNPSYIIIFILMSFNIYYAINLSRTFNTSLGFQPEEKSTNKANGIGILVVLCIWQIFIYMLSDGFKYNRTSESTGGMFKLVAIMIFVYIIFNFVITEVKDAQCKEWNNKKRVNDIKEISANILITSIIAGLMIATISNSKPIDI